MQKVKKINYKQYFPLTMLTTILCMLFSRHLNDVYGILFVYLSTIINHILLISVLNDIVLPYTDSNIEKTDKLSLSFKFIGKVVIIFAGLYLGVLLMGNRVIIPLLNYVFQIFVLIFCLKK